MPDAAVSLYAQALAASLLLSLPVVAAVGLVGVVIGLLQTVIQIQDQNVSFGPKILVVAAMATGGGAMALTILVSLFQAAVASLPLFSAH